MVETGSHLHDGHEHVDVDVLSSHFGGWGVFGGGYPGLAALHPGLYAAAPFGGWELGVVGAGKFSQIEYMVVCIV